MNNPVIQKLLAEGEGVRLEFKRSRDALNRDVYETVCAFLNRAGGDLLLGVADDGMVTGIQADVFRTVIPLPESAEEKSSPKSSPKSLAKTEDRVLALIRADECITAEKMGAEIGVSKRAILKQIDKLKKQQRLERVGAAKGGHWKVLDG